MVLSLAFILAFVFSAIVLLIGIIIFSEIAEAMEATLPSQGTVLPPNKAISLGNLTANPEWQLREQRAAVNGTTNPVDCDLIAAPTQLLVELFPSKPLQGFCHVFKVFDKSDIIGKNLTVNWSQDLPDGDSRIHVLDGAYDSKNATQFPLDTTASPTSTGFTATLAEGLKGGGVQHLVFRDGVFDDTDTVNLTLPTSVLDQITVDISILDRSNTVRPAMQIPFVEITDFAKWQFGSDFGGSVTFSVTGTNNDVAVATTSIESLLPLILSESDQQQVDTFNNAQAIGFTVVGILPVALFFALFSIFSGRIE